MPPASLVRLPLQEEEKAVLRDTAHRAEREAQLLLQLQRSEQEKVALREEVKRAEIAVQHQTQTQLQATLQRSQEINASLQQQQLQFAVGSGGGGVISAAPAGRVEYSDPALATQLRRTEAEAAALRRELNGLDPAFFEDVEDMKYK
jgi:alcohol dehydrogenase class IV